MRISDWSSDVCSSDLDAGGRAVAQIVGAAFGDADADSRRGGGVRAGAIGQIVRARGDRNGAGIHLFRRRQFRARDGQPRRLSAVPRGVGAVPAVRSEEHTSELQSLMRISYAVFCLKKKK